MPTQKVVEEQLQLDWLDALAILQRALDSHSVRELWQTYAPEINSLSSSMHLVVQDTKSRPGLPIRLWLNVHHEWDLLPKIERVEMMTYAAAGAWFQLAYPGNPFETPRDAFQHLCQRAGCCSKNTPNIRERWRLIDYFAPAHTLPNAVFEDRPRCGICSTPCATGSFSLTNTKRALHEECDRYVHKVLAPQAAELAARIKGSAGEVDR